LQHYISPRKLTKQSKLLKMNGSELAIFFSINSMFSNIQNDLCLK